jgi:antitoxin HicB
MARYCVSLSAEEGDIVVRSRDFPELLTFGRTQEEALAMAEDALVVVILGRMDRDEDVPVPAKSRRGEIAVPLPAQTAAKLAVWQAFRQADIPKAELARRLDVGDNEVQRILDPRYGTKLDKLEAAAKALGVRLVVSTETA